MNWQAWRLTGLLCLVTVQLWSSDCKNIVCGRRLKSDYFCACQISIFLNCLWASCSYALKAEVDSDYTWQLALSDCFVNNYFQCEECIATYYQWITELNIAEAWWPAHAGVKFPETKCSAQVTVWHALSSRRSHTTVLPQNPRSLGPGWYQNLVSGLTCTVSIPLGIEEPDKLHPGIETAPTSSVHSLKRLLWQAQALCNDTTLSLHLSHYNSNRLDGQWRQMLMSIMLWNTTLRQIRHANS